jgi:hypothetical protein
MTKTVYYTHKFESPESEAIAGAWYNADSRELWVDFKTGSRAGYKGVHNYIWNQFNTADSKGGFFASKIRGYYAGISGDVVFVPGYDDTATSIPSTPESPAPVETRATSVFRVKFLTQIEGEFSVSATSMEEALRFFYELDDADLLELPGQINTTRVKEVTQVFDN